MLNPPLNQTSLCWLIYATTKLVQHSQPSSQESCHWLFPAQELPQFGLCELLPWPQTIRPRRTTVSVSQQFSRAAITKDHKLGGLKQEKCIVLQLWRLQVQDRGVSRAMLPLEPVGEGSFLVSSSCWRPQIFLGYGNIILISVSVLTFSLCLFSPSSLYLCLPPCLNLVILD